MSRIRDILDNALEDILDLTDTLNPDKEVLKDAEQIMIDIGFFDKDGQLISNQTKPYLKELLKTID